MFMSPRQCLPCSAAQHETSSFSVLMSCLSGWPQGFFVLAFILNITFLYFPPFGLPKSSIGATQTLRMPVFITRTNSMLPVEYEP